MVIEVRQVVTLMLCVGIMLNVASASGSSKAISLPQDRLLEKEWQFDNSSGIAVYIAGHSTIDEPPERRDIYLLIDKSHFNKENLVRVFTYYAKKYDRPVWLTIKAFSDKESLRVKMVSSVLNGADIPWETLPDFYKRNYGLPSDLSKWKMSGLYAWYWRDNMDEYFDYTPSPDSRTFDKVIGCGSFRTTAKPHKIRLFCKFADLKQAPLSEIWLLKSHISLLLGVI